MDGYRTQHIVQVVAPKLHITSLLRAEMRQNSERLEELLRRSTEQADTSIAPVRLVRPASSPLVFSKPLSID